MERRKRPMTLTEKILLQHAVGWDRADLAPGDVVHVAVDWTLASEIAWSGMDRTYQALGRPPLADSDRVYLAVDHTVDRRSLAEDPRTRCLVEASRSFAREAGLRYFYDANTTIMHTEFFRQLVRPGEVVLGADSHTTSHGAMGAFAVGLGGADVVAAMVRKISWIQVPEAVRVHFAGHPPFGVTGKDAILETLGRLGRNTVALERSVEYTADYLEELSTDFRFTVCNMTVELGGVNGVFPADVRTREAMAGRLDPAFGEGGYWFRADLDAEYAESVRIDLADLAPKVARPGSPDDVCAVDEVEGEPLDGCFIGACTTSEEELVLAALVLERELDGGVRPVPSDNRLVVPGSLEITDRLARAGLLDVYRRAGFRVGEPACSMCIGLGSDRARSGEAWLSSQNRNFPNRMGPGSTAWLASAPTVAVSSLYLRIRDPRPALQAIDRDRLARLLSPRDGLSPVVYGEPEVAPPATGGHRIPRRPTGSSTLRGRVQLFGDHVDTDAMIAAEFCHQSDPAELGPRAFLHFRPEFRERVRHGETILVAGEGWGTGSSREQAVWALAGAGVQAVIAKSFAYIHKRNLVNEALPFVVVDDPEFHRAVRDGDELEIAATAGTVRLQGKDYRGIPLAGAMAEIVSSGGLVSHLKESLGPAVSPGRL